MKRMIPMLTLCLCCCFVIACGEPVEDSNEITKEQAKLQGGKSDDGRDWCEVMDWYGDGICDAFCPKPDSDCDTDPACASDADCAAGQICNNGTCEDTLPGCSADADCAAGDVCVNGQCEAATGDTCGTILGLTCAAGEVCIFPEGTCNISDNAGTCVAVPNACNFNLAPVCGCDGVTYNNECDALLAGASIDHQGECGVVACAASADCAANETCIDGACTRVCGGFAGFTCEDGEFCDWEDDQFCGAADHLGICKPAPDVCTDIDQPVCGCDGVTYSNECEANAAGVDAASDGACRTFCSQDADCSNNEVCVNGVCEVSGGGDQCNTNADCQGNELCRAGICKKFCGGFAGFTCAATEFCDYDAGGQACGIADGGGVCEARPDACIQVFDPVCGCDQNTYGNACEANMAGVDVFADGPCN